MEEQTGYVVALDEPQFTGVEGSAQYFPKVPLRSKMCFLLVPSDECLSFNV